MFYLVTNENNENWQNVSWGENVTHEENNPNYYFVTYDDPHVAAYMYPLSEITNQPKFWTVEQQSEKIECGYQFLFEKITTLKEFTVSLPTPDQKITFGMLCSMMLVKNKEYREWAINYLNGSDKSKESALLLEKKLKELILSKEVYLHPCFAVISSICEDESYAIKAAHKSYMDAIDASTPIDLKQIAQIVNSLTPLEISETLQEI